MSIRALGPLLLFFLLAGRVLGQAPVAGLRAEYYAGQNFERRVLTRTDAAIDFDWATHAPGPGLSAESFSVRWTGYVLAPATGTYTFYLAAPDGMRVWIGGRPLIAAVGFKPTTKHATATRRLTAHRYYSLRVEYVPRRHSRRAYLGWTLPAAPTAAPALLGARYLTSALPASATPLGPSRPSPQLSAKSESGGTIGIVPANEADASAAEPASPDIVVPPNHGAAVAGKVPAGTGLQATYYAGAPHGPAAQSRVEPVVDVTWRGAAPGVPGQGFSVRWTGYVRAPETGVYVLHTQFDDATDISFAGENVLSMEKYEPEFFLPHKPPVPVDVVQYYTAGNFYRIDLAYKDVRGVSRAVLSWARPAEMGHPTMYNQAFKAAKGSGLTVVPQSLLYPTLPEPPAVAVAPAPVDRPTPVRPVAAPRAPVRPAPLRPVAARVPRPTAPLLPLLPNLATLRRGTAVALPNLYFTQSTAHLLPTSRPVLNSLTRALRQQPELRLEIAGHTDNVGDARLNLRLSEQRAQVVRRYLVRQGIDSVRLTSRGYGGTSPVADNRDPRQRPRNRRVEVVVQ